MAKRKPKSQVDEPTAVVEETPVTTQEETVNETSSVVEEQPSTEPVEEQQVTVEVPDVTEDPEIQQDLEEIIDASKSELGDKEVNDVLSHPDMHGADKIAKIAAEGATEFSMAASSIVSYIDAVDESKPFVSAANIANKNYNLYNAIRQIVNTEDQANFQTKMRILTNAFVTHKDGAFNEFKLHRYDYAWSWGDKSLKTYQHLIVLFTSLSDLSTRASEIKKLDMNAVLDSGVIDLPVDTCDRLKRYFS